MVISLAFEQKQRLNPFLLHFSSDFNRHYYSSICAGALGGSAANGSRELLDGNATSVTGLIKEWAEPLLANLTREAALNQTAEEPGLCRRDSSLLFLLLMLGTVWVAVSLYNFNKTYVACARKGFTEVDLRQQTKHINSNHFFKL